MLQFSADLDMSSFSSDITNHMGDISNQYESYKVKVRNGELGKTPKFWLMYLDLVKQQHFAHTAVQENNMDMLIHSWKSFLPYYFALKQTQLCKIGILLSPLPYQYGKINIPS